MRGKFTYSLFLMSIFIIAFFLLSFTFQQSCLENCDNYDKWVCGCPGYRSDKYKCFMNYYCSNGTCVYIYEQSTYCGTSTDSDNGDNPTTAGIVIDRYCSDGSCQNKSYSDTCSGICSRNELIEYYVQNDRATSKTYKDLFSINRYCKNGAVYIDNLNPQVSISPSSRDWDKTDVSITIYCNDNDESGCWKYNYQVVRIL